jgi:RHS repeat-associated protein
MRRTQEIAHVKRAMMHSAITACLLACLLSAPLCADDRPRFRPAADVDPVIGRYLVAFAGDAASDDDATAAALARAYGGRLEPFSAQDFRGVMLMLRPAQARALSNDLRVAWVEERPLGSDSAIAPAAIARTPTTEWTATPALWESGTYLYDDAGNIQQIGTDIYRYDKVGRLTRGTAGAQPPELPATIPQNQQDFSYDIYGNLTTVTTKTVNGTTVLPFSVDADTNQLRQSCPPNVSCVTGIYDAAGNQLGQTVPGAYTWDALGVMTELHTNRHERYVYDSGDERIAIIEYVGDAETRRRFTLRGPDNKVARELTFFATSGTWTAKDYVYRGSTLMASFSTAAGEPDRHYHVDHLGSTRVVSDAYGYRLNTHTYWPFGLEADGSEPDAERMKFTGHERDTAGLTPGFELDYMHARYYDPNMNRFLSVDPGGFDANNPQSWNRYLYADNNPLLKTDPDGRASQIVVGAVIGGFVGLFVGGISEIQRGYHQPVTWEGSTRRVLGAVAGGAVSGAAGAVCGSCGFALRTAIGTGGNVAGGIVNRHVAGRQQTVAALKQDAANGVIGSLAGEAGGKILTQAAKNRLSQLSVQGAIARTEAAAQNLGHVRATTSAEHAVRNIKSQVNATATALSETVSNLEVVGPVRADRPRESHQ